MTCARLDNPDICPTADQVTDELVALLPPGRAFGMFSGGPNPSPTIRSFWAAIGATLAAMEARICALREEFWCSSQTLTNDLWLADYGLPDACDPFPDLCTKVAAIGGTRCDYFADVAARAGWSIACVGAGSACGALGDGVYADGGTAGGIAPPASALQIIVYVAESAALGGYVQAPNEADAMRADMMLSCAPSIAPLECLMARIVPAHVAITYTTL